MMNKKLLNYSEKLGKLKNNPLQSELTSSLKNRMKNQQTELFHQKIYSKENMLNPL